MTNSSARLGVRLRAVREQRSLSQEQLADLFGFNDRQTVSAIETGERRLSADELILAVQKLGITLDDLVDPFRLTEGRFSWRQTNVAPRRLKSFEAVAGRWIAAFREIAHLSRTARETRAVREPLNLDRNRSTRAELPGVPMGAAAHSHSMHRNPAGMRRCRLRG